MRLLPNIYLFILCIFFGLTAAAQSPSKKGWYFGIAGAPELAYRTLRNNGGTSTQDLFNTRDSIEIPKLSYTVGIDVQRYLKPRLVLEFGAYYSVKGENTRVYHMKSPIAAYPVAQSVEYRTAYLELPVKVNYHFNERDFSPYVTGGVSGNIFLDERVTEHNTYVGTKEPYSTVITYDGSEFRHNDPYAPVNPCIHEKGYYRVNAQLQLGFGIDYTRARYKLKIEPIFKYSLSDVNDGPLNRKFYSIGLNVGLFLKTKTAKTENVINSRKLN